MRMFEMPNFQVAVMGINQAATSGEEIRDNEHDILGITNIGGVSTSGLEFPGINVGQ